MKHISPFGEVILVATLEVEREECVAENNIPGRQSHNITTQCYLIRVRVQAQVRNQVTVYKSPVPLSAQRTALPVWLPLVPSFKLQSLFACDDSLTTGTPFTWFRWFLRRRLDGLLPLEPKHSARTVHQSLNC